MTPTHGGGPGEWVPSDNGLKRWRIVCVICRGVSRDVASPFAIRELEVVRIEFLREHGRCASKSG